MPDVRPLRLYRHTFFAGDRTVVIVRSGQSPCASKNAAFEALEAQIAENPALPRKGWRHLKQEDVTHLIQR